MLDNFSYKNIINVLKNILNVYNGGYKGRREDVVGVFLQRLFVIMGWVIWGSWMEIYIKELCFRYRFVFKWNELFKYKLQFLVL